MQQNIPGEPESACVASSADGGKLFLLAPKSIYSRYSPPGPRLNLAPSSSNFSPSWIVPSTNFVLQQNSDLAMANWVTLTNMPVLILTNLWNQIILSSPNGNGFYRPATP
jgi:hypothetical protein